MKIKTITPRFFLFISLLFSLITVNAQTTVYSNDFNIAENPLTSAGNPGTPAMTWTNVTTGAGTVRTGNFPSGTSNYALQITNNTSTAGRTYTYGGLSTFSDPFQATLSSNTNYIIWTLNMRIYRSSTSVGFDVTNGYGSAVVLCADGSNFLTANGYAVTLMRGTDKNAVRLVKFTGGLSANANLTTIIGPSAESTSYTDYYSVKVIYTPATNKWQLFSRIDGTSIVDPESGTLTQVGTETVDETYTNTAMSYFGFLFNHQTTTGPYYTCFDNFKVVATPNITTDLHVGSQIRGIVKPISGGFSVSAENANVKVYDTTGKLLNNKQVNGTLDFSCASKGLYVIQIKTTTGVDAIKYVVK